jgi:hypothetical protein
MMMMTADTLSNRGYFVDRHSGSFIVHERQHNTGSLSFSPCSHITALHDHHNNKMWHQIKVLFCSCFGGRETIEQPARPHNPTRPALRRSSFS